MRLGIAQIDAQPGDLAQITERVVACSRIAADRGCELLLFPLATLAGPMMLPRSAQRVFRQETLDALGSRAGELGCACVLPMLSFEDGMPGAELVVADGGEVRTCRHPGASYGPDTSQAGEGPGLLILEAAGLRLCFVFSYEELDWLGGPDDPGGYDAIAFASGYGYAVNDPSSALGAALVEGRFREDVRATGRWLVGLGSVGGYGGQVFGGSSFVLAPDGRIAACAAAFEEDLVVAELDAGSSLAGLEQEPEPYDEACHLWQALALGLSDYVRRAAREGVVLVYDASLGARMLAALACDALGPTRVRIAPDPALAPDGARELEKLASALRVRLLGQEPGTAGAEGAPASSDADLSARLLVLCEDERLAMLSTRDKTDLALGIPRLWERFAELMPLGDVYRSELVAMLRLRGAIAPMGELVKVAKSDLPALQGLSDGREDDPEALLAQVDALLERHVEGEESFSEICARSDGAHAELARAVAETYAACAPGRAFLPRCLIASTCTLAECQLPLGFAWHDQGATRLRSQVPARPASEAPPPEAHVAERPQAEASRDQAGLEQALREALDLLRDISVGSGADWKNPFSEN